MTLVAAALLHLNISTLPIDHLRLCYDEARHYSMYMLRGYLEPDDEFIWLRIWIGTGEERQSFLCGTVRRDERNDRSRADGTIQRPLWGYRPLMYKA